MNKKQPEEKESSLAVRDPELAKQWHPIKNGEISPCDVELHSNVKVWWQCEQGHEWQATPNNRATEHSGCPYCRKARVLVGLDVTNPQVAKQWHPTKNGELTPDMVSRGSNKKVWWQCENGHEWEAVILSRTRGNGCPYCSGRYVTKGVNDLATLCPDIAKEWHPTKNGDLTPCMVTKNSRSRVWWRCKKGHEWKTAVYNRTKNKTNCPHCWAEQYNI